MNALVKVELSRYRSRRVILLLLLAGTLLTALVAFKTAWDTRPPSATEIATAKAAAQSDAGRAGGDTRTTIAECEKNPDAYLDPGAPISDCAHLGDSAKTYLPRAALDLEGTLKGNGIGIALLLVGLLIIAASTFAGSDFSSGSIRNQVLFEPRRTRVWAAKAAAVAIWSGVVSLVLLGGFWLTLYLVASDRGVPHGSAILDDVAWHLVRAVLLAVAASVGAFALTTLFRSAAATIGLLFAYSIGGELLVLLLPISGFGRWSLGNNVYGWLETRLEFLDTKSACVRAGTCDAPVHISHLDAGIYLLVVLLIAVAASVLAFRRRDI